MRDTIVSVIVVLVMFGLIWWNYRMFMRGNWPEQKVRSLLPADFKPNHFHVKADTYVGVEKGTDRIALVDAQNAKVIEPRDVVSIEAEEERIWGLRHQWLVISVRDRVFPRYRIWFQFDRGKRDGWLQRLREMCGGASRPADRAGDTRGVG